MSGTSEAIPAVPELIDYEVGLGARLRTAIWKDGVWARQVRTEMEAVLRGLHAVFAELRRAAAGRESRQPRPTRCSAVISFTASRPRRMLCAYILSPTATDALPGCLSPSSACGMDCRCSCTSSLGRRARTTFAPAGDSIGRPPDFVGNHTTTTAVFARMLADVLTGERVS